MSAARKWVRSARAALIAVAAVAAITGWAEWEHWRSSRRGFGSVGGGWVASAAWAASVARESIVVLGFHNRGSRANYINRWRVRAGIRSRHPNAGSSRLVFCGGANGGSVAESVLMADYARDVCHYAGEIAYEAESTNTWENIQNAIPLIGDADQISIVSNSLHAEKARIYLRRLRPDLAARLVPAAEYRFGELFVLKPVLAVIGLRNLRRARREVGDRG